MGVSVVMDNNFGNQSGYGGYMNTLKIFYQRKGKDENEVAYDEDNNRKYADIDLNEVE